MSAFFAIFITIFLAELGDKTQLATMLFASDENRNRWVVFIASASALVASTGLAIALGIAAERWFSALPLKLIAGTGFIVIGIWMIIENFRSV